MKRPRFNIFRLAALALLLVLTMASAMAQTNSVPVGQTSSLGVNPIPPPGAAYVWDLYIVNNALIGSFNFATEPANCPIANAEFVGGNTSPTVSVIWHTAGTYYFRVIVTDAAGCQNLKVGTMEVLDCTPPDVSFTPCYNIITSQEAQPFKLKGGLPFNGVYSSVPPASPWVTNAGAGVYLFNPQLAPLGPVAVNYTYTNAAGCSATVMANIQNNPAPANFTCGAGNWLDIRDNNKSYPTVSIVTANGTQCWLAENMNYGTRIQSSQVQSDNCLVEKYCYNNDPVNCNGAGGQPALGGLYQWDELMSYDNTPGSQGICPPGWHVPVESEWMDLFNVYGGVGRASLYLQTPALSGFNVLMGGVLYQNDTWAYKDLSATLFWTSTPASADPFRVISHGMNNKDESVSLYESLRSNAFPVRCLKDN